MGTSGAAFNAKDHGIWTPNAYTVTFHANGGDGSMDGQPMTYDQTADLMANRFTRAGYTFAGWSLTADGEVIYTDRAQVSNLSAENGAAVTLYAQWTADEGTTYTVEYYLENLAGDGYDVQTETFSGVTESTATVTAKNITGFTYDSGNADNVLSGEIAGDGSLVLKLYYTRNSYTLTLDFGAENIKAMAELKHIDPDGYTWTETVLDHPELKESGTDVTVKYGQSLGEVLRSDYEVSVFKGIEDIRDGDGYWIGYEDVYETSALEDAFPGYTFGGWGVDETAAMPAEDLTLTAQWNPIEVKVTFYADYGIDIGAPVTNTYSYGDTIPLSHDLNDYQFVNDGKFISGWSYGNAASDGAPITGELVLIDCYYSYYGSYYSVSGGDDDAMAPGEVHIYAFWSYEDERCTVTFNGNGATNVEPYTQAVDGGGYVYVMLMKNAYTRDGYRFIGWNTEKDGSGYWYNDMDGFFCTEDGTLYAQWEPITE